MGGKVCRESTTSYFMEPHGPLLGISYVHPHGIMTQSDHSLLDDQTMGEESYYRVHYTPNPRGVAQEAKQFGTPCKSYRLTWNQ